MTGGEPFPFAVTGAEERNGRLSPDGRWMAYTWNQSGADEVYVQPFPEGGSRWQVSRDGGRQPAWSPDGRQVFYIARGRRLVAVDVKTGESTFFSGTPEVVMDTTVGGWERTRQGSPFAVGPERFLISRGVGGREPITALLNWTTRMRQ